MSLQSGYYHQDGREHKGGWDILRDRNGHVAFLYLNDSNDPIIGRITRDPERRYHIVSGSEKYDLIPGSTLIIPCYNNGSTEFERLDI